MLYNAGGFTAFNTQKMNDNTGDLRRVQYLDCGHAVHNVQDVGGTDSMDGTVHCKECIKLCEMCGRAISPAHQRQRDDKIYCPHCAFKSGIVGVISLTLKIIGKFVRIIVDGITYWMVRIFEAMGL